MSFKGIGLKYFALALAVIAIVAGTYLTFFQSSGFEKTTATIVSIRATDLSTQEDPEYVVTVRYEVDGREYTQTLDQYSPSYDVGETVDVLYDPKDPSVIHGGRGFGIYVLVIGVVILAVVIGTTVKGRMALKKLKETEEIGKNATYPPAEPGEERELYFLTDLGTPKYGHRIEDANRRVLIEAKMTKYTLTAPFGFDFIDHVGGGTTAHLIGHEEAAQRDFLLLDDHYTITFDGEDIWKHLKRNGIRVDSRLGGGSGKLLGANFTIYRDDVELARVESTSQHVHEEDAEAHGKLGSVVPVKGFYRIWTKEQNLGLLFVTLLAFARTDASADNGGNYKTLFGSFKSR